jgi:hypothetical protein
VEAISASVEAERSAEMGKHYKSWSEAVAGEHIQLTFHRAPRNERMDLERLVSLAGHGLTITKSQLRDANVPEEVIGKSPQEITEWVHARIELLKSLGMPVIYQKPLARKSRRWYGEIPEPDFSYAAPHGVTIYRYYGHSPAEIRVNSKGEAWV